MKAYDEVYFIKRSKEYRHLREGKLGLEATSPIRLLRAQKHAGPHGGFYHDHCRNDPITAFKLWHMSYRMRNNDEFPPQHPCEKIPCSRDRCFPCHGSLGSGVHGPQVEERDRPSALVTFAAPMTKKLTGEVVRCRGEDRSCT